MKNTLTVGVVQTSLQFKAAWKIDSLTWQDAVQISTLEEARAKKEIRHYLSTIQNMEKRPDIVLLPELSVPNGFETQIQRSAESLEAIIIAGIDYRIHSESVHPTVSNGAIIVVPRKLGGRRLLGATSRRIIGKTYAAPAEKKRLSSVAAGSVAFRGDPKVWIFRSADIGDFGVAICYDFLDLDRIVSYKAQIQSLFILAYNPDATSFYHAAEALSRLVFCNVVICNCGFFGGSLAVSPYRKAYKRTVFQTVGARLPGAQVFDLPLKSLKEHQEGSQDHNDVYKSLPPGYCVHRRRVPLTVAEDTIVGT